MKNYLDSSPYGVLPFCSNCWSRAFGAKKDKANGDVGVLVKNVVRGKKRPD